jgi:hypothetical protein
MCLFRAITTHVLTFPTKPVSSITAYITVIGTTMYRGSRFGPHVLVMFAEETGGPSALVSAVDGSVIIDQLDSAKNVTFSAGGMIPESVPGLSWDTNMTGLRHSYVTRTGCSISGWLTRQKIELHESLSSTEHTFCHCNLPCDLHKLTRLCQYWCSICWSETWNKGNGLWISLFSIMFQVPAPISSVFIALTMKLLQTPVTSRLFKSRSQHSVLKHHLFLWRKAKFHTYIKLEVSL